MITFSPRLYTHLCTHMSPSGKDAFSNLNRLYREHPRSTPSTESGMRSLTYQEKRAYVWTRMPATYGASVRILQELRACYTETASLSLLEIGSGPGSGLDAAMQALPISRYTALEGDRSWSPIAEPITKLANIPVTHFYTYVPPLPSGLCFHDVVMFSYSFNELTEKDSLILLDTLWENAGFRVLVIIEPGTPYAYQRLMQVRNHALQKGCGILAPCPHSRPCPLTSTWCHMQVRVARSTHHMHLKGGTCNFEDEPVSYLILTRTLHDPGFQSYANARLIHHPLKRKGHVCLRLCSAGGDIQDSIITKSKDASLYAKARHATWGDGVPLTSKET